MFIRAEASGARIKGKPLGKRCCTVRVLSQDLERAHVGHLVVKRHLAIWHCAGMDTNGHERADADDHATDECPEVPARHLNFSLFLLVFSPRRDASAFWLFALRGVHGFTFDKL